MPTLDQIKADYETELLAVDEEMKADASSIQLFDRKLNLTKRHFDSLGRLSDQQDAEDRKKNKNSGNNGGDRISTRPELKPIRKGED